MLSLLEMICGAREEILRSYCSAKMFIQSKVETFRATGLYLSPKRSLPFGLYVSTFRLRRIYVLNSRVILLECSTDGISHGLHLLSRKLELGVGEEHVFLALHGDEVDMCMRHFQTQDGFADLHAGDDLLDGTSHAGCEDMEAGNLIVLKVEDIIYFATGDDERVPLHHRIDVEESIELLIAGAAIAGDFACGDFTEDTHRLILRN